jgi:hypothetical protein
MILDLDQDLINHLAMEDSVYELRAEHVKPELIVDSEARKVFEWQLEHLHRHGTPATEVVLKDQFPKLEISQPQTAIGDLISRFRERFIRNQGKAAITELANTAVAKPLEVAKDMMQEAKRLVDLTARRGESFGSGDIDQALRVYDEQALKPKGPSLGWTELDDFFYGQRGLSFLIAPPKSYKSWATVNALVAQTVQGEFPYLYSLELPAKDADWRVRCLYANIPYWKYLRGSLSPEERKAIKKSSQELDSYGTYRVEKPDQGERSIAYLVERAMAAGATCLFIDQLQYVETRKGPSLGALNDTGYYWEVCDDLRNYSDEIPIFIVHQFNRSAMGATGMPEFQQIKASAAMEETGTLLLGMFSTKEMKQSNLLQIGTLLSRHYALANWEIKVELSKGCSFDLIGKVEDDE